MLTHPVASVVPSVTMTPAVLMTLFATFKLASALTLVQQLTVAPMPIAFLVVIKATVSVKLVSLAIPTTKYMDANHVSTKTPVAYLSSSRGSSSGVHVMKLHG